MSFRLRYHLLALSLGTGSMIAWRARSALAQGAEPRPAAPAAPAAPAPAAPAPAVPAAPAVPVAPAPAGLAPATPSSTGNEAPAAPSPVDAGLAGSSGGSNGAPDAAAPPEEPPAAAEPESDLGTVTVTAQRRENTVQKTPISITAFGEDAIKQKKISDFRDLSGRVPGLTLPLRSTAYTTQTFSIRGIGETDTYPEPSVALYIDDVYIARSVGSIYDTPDLERVEVLRGPQGTLYGRNSAAGAIRFITKEPKAERTAGLSVTLGNYNNVLLKARLSGGILPDNKLNVSVSAVRHQRRGWTYAIPLAQWVNDLDIWALRSKVKSQVTERLSVSLAGDVMLDRSTASYYTPVYQPNGKFSGQPTNPDQTWSNTIPLNKTTVYGGSLTFKYDLDDNLSLKSVTAVRGMHGPIYYDNDGVSQIKGDSYAGFNQNYETQEFTINGDYDKLNFVGGLTVSDIEHTESQTLTGVSVIKIFFHPGAKVEAATAQITAVSRQALRALPPGASSPLILRYSASNAPVMQLAIESEALNRSRAKVAVTDARRDVLRVDVLYGRRVCYEASDSVAVGSVDVVRLRRETRGTAAGSERCVRD